MGKCSRLVDLFKMHIKQNNLRLLHPLILLLLIHPRRLHLLQHLFALLPYEQSMLLLLPIFYLPLLLGHLLIPDRFHDLRFVKSLSLVIIFIYDILINIID